MIAPLEKVVRSDGTRVLLAETLSTKKEIKKIASTLTSKLILLSGIFAFWTFFYKCVILFPRVPISELIVSAVPGLRTWARTLRFALVLCRP